jgi:hypothetical protein
MIPIIGSLLRKNHKPDDNGRDLRWIANLPNENPIPALDIILQKLAELVPIDIPLEGWRIKALLLIDARCRRHVQALEQQYINVQKLRPELDERMWNTVYAWYRYMMRGYQTFINDHIENPSEGRFPHNYLPLVVARALHNQANIARWRYMRYLGMPDGGWLALHRLYLLAEQEGFSGKLLKIYEDQPEITVGERYVEALMLDTLNHTNLSKVQIQTVSTWLSQWSKATSVSKNLDTERFVFFVELQEDRAARRIRNFKPTPTCRYWETDRMVASIERAKKALEHGKALSEAGLPASSKTGEYIPVLNQLLSEWSRTDYQRQRRREERQKITSTAIVANGLSSVWQQIKDVAQSATQRRGGYIQVAGKSLEDRLASHSIAPSSSGPIIAFAGVAGERWIINDESPSGFGALVGAEVAGWAKLGRLIALVTEDHRETVAVSVIRSIKQREHNQRQIGVEVITRNGTHVLLSDQSATKPTDLDAASLDAKLVSPGIITLQAIIVPADEARGIGRSMLLPNAEFNPSGLYELTRGMERHTVKFGAVVEQKDDWVRVLFPENPSHQP